MIYKKLIYNEFIYYGLYKNHIFYTKDKYYQYNIYLFKSVVQLQQNVLQLSKNVLKLHQNDLQLP